MRVTDHVDGSDPHAGCSIMNPEGAAGEAVTVGEAPPPPDVQAARMSAATGTRCRL